MVRDSDQYATNHLGRSSCGHVAPAGRTLRCLGGDRRRCRLDEGYPTWRRWGAVGRPGVRRYDAGKPGRSGRRRSFRCAARGLFRHGWVLSETIAGMLKMKKNGRRGVTLGLARLVMEAICRFVSPAIGVSKNSVSASCGHPTSCAREAGMTVEIGNRMPRGGWCCASFNHAAAEHRRSVDFAR